jgi:Zn-dependent protease with chaperone function
MTKRFIACLALSALAGCATNPITGRSQLLIVSEESAIASSLQAYNTMLTPFAKSDKLDNDRALKSRIEAITSRLVAQAVRYKPDSRDWPWQVSVIDDPETVNAFCMPGGKMAIYSGLIKQLNATDDEIAQVMAHEIGHAIANHGAEKMSVQMASTAGVVALTVAGGARNQAARQAALTAAAAVAVQLPNSRDAEREADRIGIELAARAGYHPRSAVTLWEKMAKASGSESGFDFLSTHPAPVKRVEDLAALGNAMMQFYESKEARPAFPINVADAERPARVAAFQSNLAPAAGPAAPASTTARSAPPAPGPAAHAGRPPALTLFSPEFEKFSQGKAALRCASPCSMRFALNKGDMKQMHDAGNWRALAVKVLDVGYKKDLAYFYLARAAENLGYTAAARKYYEQADVASKSRDLACKSGLINTCDGFDIGKEASAGSRRMILR